MEGRVGHGRHTVQGTWPGPPPAGPGQQRQHQLMQARERQVGFGLHSYRDQHPHPAVGRVPTRRLEQRRLADAWLTAHDQRPALVRRAIDNPKESLQLGCAASQARRRGQREGHRSSFRRIPVPTLRPCTDDAEARAWRGRWSTVRSAKVFLQYAERAAKLSTHSRALASCAACLKAGTQGRPGPGARAGARAIHGRDRAPMAQVWTQADTNRDGVRCPSRHSPR